MADPSRRPDRPGLPDDDGCDYSDLEPLLGVYGATPPHAPHRRQLRDQLVMGYLPLVRHIARRYDARGEPLEDLEQAGCVGLLKAIDRFREDHHTPFPAFAIPTITGEIQHHFRDRSWSTRVPRRLKDLRVSINEAVGELSGHLNRAPRPSDIAAWLGVGLEEVLDGLHAAQAYRADSLDQIVLSGDTGPITRAETIGGADAGIERFLTSYAVAPYLTGLPERERTILIMRFYDELTQSQIAAKLGLSQMHISRLLSKTLAHLSYAVEHDESPSTSNLIGHGGPGRPVSAHDRPPVAGPHTTQALPAHHRLSQPTVPDTAAPPR